MTTHRYIETSTLSIEILYNSMLSKDPYLIRLYGRSADVEEFRADQKTVDSILGVINACDASA
jgi:hypothetical protein